MKKIPYAHQYIDLSDINAVRRAVASDWLTQGPRVKEFEEVLCGYTGAKYAVAVSSGTAALHLAMMALEIGRGDETVTSPITFSASANCAAYVGAVPRFADIDDNTCHIDIEKLRYLLRDSRRSNKVKVVVPVHFTGSVSDIAAIRDICDKNGIKIVEDAAHAVGSTYKTGGKWVKVGSCRHSDVTIFSFHPIKNITTGEGGAVLTNDKKIYEKVSRLRHHGICRPENGPKWFYDIPQIGFNYRITDFQCALGMSQMKKIDKMIKIRREIVDTYNNAFSGVEEIRLPHEIKNTRTAYHLYVIRIPAGARNRLYDYLMRKGILTQVNYIPVHLLTYYKKSFGYHMGDFPVAEKYFSECLSLPLYAGLSGQDQKRVIKEIKRFFGYE
ncbi:MAG: UDP-4-amino-4,6-dideoxy-N-acetyl-beta-L-altrosamine transaminase [Candidatus Omnitrophica bacterium]|nr:UDP-4-amino-4,6-dideoxy-N-acetyl-beta-L-altrosamine transaminase [Candidatus Omnitrophota bacterium]